MSVFKTKVIVWSKDETIAQLTSFLDYIRQGYPDAFYDSLGDESAFSDEEKVQFLKLVDEAN